MKKVLLIILTAVLFAGCSNNDEEGNTNDSETNNPGTNTEETEENDGKTDDDTTEEESKNDDGENDSDVYGGAQKNPDYMIETQVFDKEKSFYTAFSINRDEEQDLSPEDRLKSSLLNNDPSEQNILESYTDLSLEESNLEVHFNQAGNELSTTTAQSTLFYDALFGISDMYGVEES